jgi:hypothetical protein
MSRSLLLLSWAVGLCFLGACTKKDGGSSSTNAPATNTSGNPITAPVDYLGAAAAAKKSSERTLNTLGLNQAIQTFYTHEGRYPKSLNELAGSEYMRSLPQPPAGMKYDYNPSTGQVKVVPQ